jgi:uncharacterized protein YndB with AHSA1/START domain
VVNFFLTAPDGEEGKNMPRIRTAITIAQSIEEVFDWVTNACKFPRWQTSSWTGPADHPLKTGEHVTEVFSIGGHHGRIEWRVLESNPPRRWVVSGQAEGGGTATITYTLTPETHGTRFRSEFVYNIPALFAEQGDFLSLHNQLQAESAESLRRLKQTLESGMAGAFN